MNLHGRVAVCRLCRPCLHSVAREHVVSSNVDLSNGPLFVRKKRTMPVELGCDSDELES
jgi:hypothetical protein